MLYIFISFIWLTPAFLGIGFGLRKFSLAQNLSGYLLNGVLAVMLFWSIIAFVHPLDLYVELITTFLGLLLFFKERLYTLFYQLRFSWFIYLLCLLVIISGSFAPFILDHFGYYVPTIEWIKTEGWVKGVANVEWVLGQMSLWHMLQAGFSNFGDPFLRLNAIFLLYFLFYVAERKRYILLLFFPLALFFTQSPSPDLPVILLSLIVLTEIFEENKNYSALLAISMLIFAIKPTMIWVPIFVFGTMMIRKKLSFRNLGIAIFIGLIYLLKNIVVSGYPLFPTSMLATDFMWTAQSENFVTSSKFALMKSFDMVYPYEMLIQKTLPQKVLLWITLPGIKGVINVLFLLSWLVFTGFCLKAKKKVLWVLWISLLVKSVFVLLFSAQYRFFIDVLVVMYIVMLWQILQDRIIKIGVAGIAVILVVFLSFPAILNKIIPSFRLSNFMKGMYKEQIFIPQNYNWQKFTKIQLGNVSFNLVKDYVYIFDTPTPGITLYNLQEYLKMNYIPQYIDAKSKKGFYPKTLSVDERKQLENLIKEFSVKKKK